jgi:hypothetical protein
VKFHWYARGKAGLVGPEDITANYEKNAVDTPKLFQLDGMTPII